MTVIYSYSRLLDVNMCVQHLVSRHLRLEDLNDALHTQRATSIVTPKRFMHHINRECESNPQHIVLPEGLEPRILRAAAAVTRRGLAKITLLGEHDAIEAEARRLSIDISQVCRCSPKWMAGSSCALCYATSGLFLRQEMISAGSASMSQMPLISLSQSRSGYNTGS